MSGHRVVWTDHRNGPGSRLSPGNSDIYAHDLSTGKTVPACTDPSLQEKADIDGNRESQSDLKLTP